PLARLPRGAAQLVERDLARVAAGELLHQPHPADRQVHLVAAGELEDEEVPGYAADLHLGEARVAADAEFGVDDQVALIEVLEAGGERLGEGGAAAEADAAARAGAEDLLVGEQGEPVGVDEAG